ncbi:hypothetical protein [Limosilactobacillus mucosae]|uniref:hypothetical protein n=1 Tax=Limosilactobacillus mucosae TaxID=97478 RepID=UPI0022E3F5F3|nr:hypothetical protein [Limosilactobacillus mucosae]
MKLNKMSKACIVAVMVAVFAVVPLVQLNAGQNANYASASSKKSNEALLGRRLAMVSWYLDLVSK